jgi:hypothetical protein
LSEREVVFRSSASPPIEAALTTPRSTEKGGEDS